MFKTWVECKRQVIGYKGALYKAFIDLDEAEKYMGIMSRDPQITIQSSKSSSNMMKIYSDGGHNPHTGDEAWGSVVDSDGNDLVSTYRHLATDMNLRSKKLLNGPRMIIVSKFTTQIGGPHLIQQNNGAELLAALFALRLANVNHEIKFIGIDSSLIVDHWSYRLGCMQRATFDPIKVKYIDELIELASSFRKRGAIIKIEGAANPADLGHHK